MEKKWIVFVVWFVGFVVASIFAATLGLSYLALSDLLFLISGSWMLVSMWGKTRAWLSVAWFVGLIAFEMVSHWSNVKQGHLSRDEQMSVEGADNTYLLEWVFVNAVEQLLAPAKIMLSAIAISSIAGIHAFIEGYTNHKSTATGKAK